MSRRPEPSQRDILRQWERALSHQPLSTVVRDEVRGSWMRSLDAHIAPSLERAPDALNAEALERSRRTSGWFALVEKLALESELARTGRDHLLTIFDARGVMLACHGDPFIKAAMGEFNFAPGASWAEDVVGTNGPGTALALGQAVHVVGAEHFCQAWHAWQCAATPLRDPLTGQLLGAIDLSGPSGQAHPHTLELVRALGLAVERTLLAQGMSRRVTLMKAFTDERARRPGDELAMVDRTGVIVCATAGAPHELREGATVEPLQSGRPLDESARQRWGVRAAAPISDGHEPLGWSLVLGRAPVAKTRRARPNGTRYSFDDLVGGSAALRAVRRLAERASRNDLPVLLLGESGVGKEVLAQSIHAASARAHRPFVAVNCAALPAELLESELFGYVAGSFTGAAKNGGIGRFEAAEGGTLFLDEIGELSHAAQATLLRALQEGEICRVGSAAPQRIDVRVIAATQREPNAAIAAGALRRDLYYRLAVLPIELPPLRARREDARPLFEHFVDGACVELQVKRPTVEEDVWPRLAAHDWPGNVRELKNLARRLVANTDGVIGARDLPADLGVQAPAVAEADADLHRLRAALAASKTLADAAHTLGIGRSTLYRRMARFGIKPQRIFDSHN